MYHSGAYLTVNVRPERVALVEKICEKSSDESKVAVLRAPMPGSVKSISVKVDDEVIEGQVSLRNTPRKYLA